MRFSFLQVMARTTVVLLLILVTGNLPAFAAETTLIPMGAVWKYLDDGSDQGTAWRQPSYSDSGWEAGPAELGYGDGDEATIISYGGSNPKYITYYFRRSFNISDKSAIGELKFRLKRDDGAVVYLNGNELFRDNMPSGDIDYQTRASVSSGATIEKTVGASNLVNGANILAVEIHQNSPWSTDVSFDLRLVAISSDSGGGGDPPSSIAITRGPYLQLLSPRSMKILWRTNVPTNSRVRYSTSSSSQNNVADNSTETTEHSVTISGLQTARKYYYSVGTTSEVLSDVYYFYSLPDDGHPFAMRFWVLGDSGVSTGNAARVRDAYNNKVGNVYTNLILLLGGNAYNSGTDSEYQTKLFDVFSNHLRHSPIVSAFSEQDNSYFNIFDLPNGSSSGGYPSGTEKYYSFNYGIVHFVVLDSYSSNRSSSGSMLSWLREDLSRNKRPWIVALWHHAPYSKGNYDSDVVNEMAEMRQNANKILEDHGVDLVLGAHSNTYERSYFIDGHYGASNTFSSSNIVDGGDGRSNGDGEYRKNAGEPHSGTVYAVVGSSSSTGSGPLNHPAMYRTQSRLGSMSIYQNCTKMEVKWIRDDARTADYFNIRKNNVIPTISMTAPSNGATFSAGSDITISVNANDPDGTIRRVRFQRNGTHIDTDFGQPYSIVWRNVPAGNYTLTAIVEDDLCGSRKSEGVNITVK